MILSDRQIKMLKLLDKQVLNCRDCTLYRNGRAKPFWSEYSRYAIIGEAPGANEVEQGRPFVGAAGQILTRNLGSLKFRANQFLIINSVNCRAVDSVHTLRNGKPTIEQLERCSKWLRKYLKIIDPEKILCLGNFAKYYFDKNHMGILRRRGKFRNFRLDETTKEYPVLYTIHPAYALYNQDEGESILQEDLRKFKVKMSSSSNG
jgi:DNA polymerase